MANTQATTTTHSLCQRGQIAGAQKSRGLILRLGTQPTPSSCVTLEAMQGKESAEEVNSIGHASRHPWHQSRAISGAIGRVIPLEDRQCALPKDILTVTCPVHSLHAKGEAGSTGHVSRQTWHQSKERSRVTSLFSFISSTFSKEGKRESVSFIILLSLMRCRRSKLYSSEYIYIGS